MAIWTDRVSFGLDSIRHGRAVPSPQGHALMTSRGPDRPPSGSFRSLIAILTGIVLGVLVGVVFGHRMWTAAGGPERAIERLDDTIAQKQALARRVAARAATLDDQGQPGRAAAARAESRRLLSHIPVIQRRRQQLRNQLAQVQRDGVAHSLALLAWELTQFAGDLFLQVLKLLVIPLVATSMITGITSLGDVRRIGRVGTWTVVYYLSTGGLAVLLGIVLVQVIRPGVNADDTFSYVTQSVLAKEDTSILGTLLDVFRGDEDDPGSGMFPSNIFLAASKTNVLALLVFALVFGGALTTIGERGRMAIAFFHAANDAVMQMVHLVMYFAPIGIFGLVAFNIARNGGGDAFGDEVRRLGWYVTTVVVGLTVHSFLLAALLAALTRRNPVRYTYGMLQALLTALSTASSSATLPVTIECCEENNGVSNRSAGFVLPLGATVNMDGTALYEAVAVIFIAQSIGVPLGGGALLVIFLTATLAAVGAAGIPEAGLVTMVVVLTAVGLPTTGIGTILAIDWFLDRIRTTVNVYGDSIGAGIIDRYVQQSGPAAPPVVARGEGDLLIS